MYHYAHQTRMHSSRMRTVHNNSRLLGGVYLVPGECTWSGGCTWSGWVYLVWGGGTFPGGVPRPGGCTWSQGGVPGPEGVPAQGGTWSWGVYLVWGCTRSRGIPAQGSAPGPGGCTWSQGKGCTWSRGVYLVPGAVPGGVPAQVLPPPPWTDRQV